MNYIIAIAMLGSLSLNMPDQILPVAEETFDTLAMCHLRREVLIARYGVEKNSIVMCLDRDVFPENLPKQ